MQILEIDKKYLKEVYDGDISLCIGCKDGIIFDDKMIKIAFNFGNGTISDFKRYLYDKSGIQGSFGGAKGSRNFCKKYRNTNK